MTRRGRFLSAGGVNAHYLEYGTGVETIVVLASPLIRAGSYRPVIKALSGSFRVIAMDLPGAGRSQRLERPWSDERYAEWLARAFDQLGLRSAILVGHSNSGAMAVWFAAQFPARVSRLILIDIIGGSPERSIGRMLLARAVTAAKELRFSLSAGPGLIGNLLRHTRTFLHQLLRASRANVLTIAASVRIPVLLAWGARDGTVPLKAMHRLRGVVPQAAVVVNEKGNHDWIVTRPEEFAEVVRYFAGSERHLPMVRYRRA